MTRLAFAMDTPRDDRLDRVTRFSGWWLGREASRPGSLRLVVNGQPAAALLPVLRPDVGKALPDEPRAAAAGFHGDLVLPDDIAAGAELHVAIRATVDGADAALWERRMTVAAASPAPACARGVDLATVLQHPEHASCTFAPFAFGPRPAGTVPIVAGVPHFHPEGALPAYRLLDTQPTHRLGAMLERILGEVGPTRALDFGAGVPGPERLRDNVVNLDAIHFPNVDVCSSYARLPFRDGAFGLVFSLAVFEHLPDPRAAALEVARVLKPGGLFFVDTAFMQPLHADPDHFFNMTMSGLRRVLAGFEILDIGVKVNHMPSKGLAMQLETVLPLMREGRWQARLQALLDELRAQGDELDEALGAIGRETLAAGYYALARRA